MRSVDVVSRLYSGAQLESLQAFVAKTVLLACCILLSPSVVFPEAAASSASRKTELPSVTVTSTETSLINQRLVNDWVARWQRRLALEDWKIETQIVRLRQLPKGTIANIHWSLPKKTATIKVLDPIDSTLPELEIARDTELSVVHELVHLSMAKLPLDSSNTELEEETVKKLSAALLALDKSDEVKAELAKNGN
jgi:hypothetical protein